MRKSFKRFAVVAALTAAAGYVVGVLTAPQSGKATRADIKSAANNGLSEAEKKLKTVSGELAELLTEARKRTSALTGKASEELETLTEKAKAAREKAREMVSAVHEGDAADDDLRIAVHQADSALKHLREYLKK